MIWSVWAARYLLIWAFQVKYGSTWSTERYSFDMRMSGLRFPVDRTKKTSLDWKDAENSIGAGIMTVLVVNNSCYDCSKWQGERLMETRK